jgi:hypothetical protein
MPEKPPLKPEDLGKKLREQLNPVLDEPVPDKWHKAFARQVHRHSEQEWDTEPGAELSPDHKRHEKPSDTFGESDEKS